MCTHSRLDRWTWARWCNSLPSRPRFRDTRFQDRSRRRRATRRQLVRSLTRWCPSRWKLGRHLEVNSWLKVLCLFSAKPFPRLSNFLQCIREIGMILDDFQELLFRSVFVFIVTVESLHADHSVWYIRLKLMHLKTFNYYGTSFTYIF